VISSELGIVLLIFVLYGSTSVVFLYANEGTLARVIHGIRIQIGSDSVRIVGRSPTLLNPLTPMYPAFRGRWGNAHEIAAAPGLRSRVDEAISASNVLAPYAIVVALYVVVGIPAALLLGGPLRAVPVALLAYLATVAMLVRLWFLREEFSLSGKQFAVVAFESILCLPFGAGVVRRLSLMIPVVDDLASFTTDMQVNQRIDAITILVRRCAEMQNLYSEDSAEFMRLRVYGEQLRSLSLNSSPLGPAWSAFADTDQALDLGDVSDNKSGNP
jgi:hypothetical protein